MTLKELAAWAEGVAGLDGVAVDLTCYGPKDWVAKLRRPNSRDITHWEEGDTPTQALEALKVAYERR